MNDQWTAVLTRELSGNGVVDDTFVNMVVHAPMPPRMRNELINRGYARMANRLNELLGAADGFAPPNFFCFAHWASAYVGTRMGTVRGKLIGLHLENGNAVVFHSMARAFLAFEREVRLGERSEDARQFVERSIPAAARVNSDVDALVDIDSGMVIDSLVDPVSGLPETLVRDVEPSGRCGSAELLARVRRRGFDEYHAAIRSTDEASRRAAILRGNAWLVISEQAMVDAALTRAMRSLVRSVLRPIASVRGSRRTWRNDRVGPIRHGLEDAWIELMSKTLEWPSPDSVLSDAAPLSFRPSGPASVCKWLRAEPRTLPAAEPFSHFEVPVLDEGRLFWTSLRHRLPVIFAVLAATHEQEWFDDSGLRKHPSWAGFEDAAAVFVESMGSGQMAPLPDQQRREDWAIAAGLFHQHRELILAALFTRSLPATYTSPAGAALLDLRAHGLAPCSRRPTKHALADDSLPRLRASARFLEAMFMSEQPPGLGCEAKLDGRSKQEWLDGVERVHTHVRDRISHAVAEANDRVPNPSHFDDPLGYEQCIGAGVSFVVPVIETLAERFAVRWSADERDSWSRVWAEITLHQGLNTALKRADCDDFLRWGSDHKPLLTDFSYADFLHADREIRLRHEARSLSGVRLADKLRRDLEDAVPFALRPLIKIGFDVFGESRVNRLLLLPPSRLSPVAAWLVQAMPAVTRVVTRRFLDIVLREVESAPAERPWDERFSPSFDPRTEVRAPALTLAA